MPKYSAAFRPDLGYQGQWVIFQRMSAFEKDWLIPRTSRSSEESARYWIEQQPKDPPTKTIRERLATLFGKCPDCGGWNTAFWTCLNKECPSRSQRRDPE